MSYVFKSDINIEYPFYKEMISKLSGSKSKSLFNGQEKYEVICPRCKKEKAIMGYAKTKDTFMLACPVDGCDLNGIVLHDLIKRYGGIEMFDRWRKARWTPVYSEEWLPIKNRNQN